MAKAARLPKLKWVRDRDREYVAGPFRITRSEDHPALWMIISFSSSGLLGYGSTVAEAKAIAQAFADSETLRGEGG